MSTPPVPPPPTLDALPHLTLPEVTALTALGLEADDYAALLAPCSQMGVGFGQDPATGRQVLVLQAVVTMDAEAINLRPSKLLDASGQRGVAGGDMKAILPVGGALRLIVKRSALAERLRDSLSMKDIPGFVPVRVPE